MIPNFSELVRCRTGAYVPLKPAELERAIVQPAQPEARLVLSDAAYRPGTIHLFQGHAEPIQDVAYSLDGRFALPGSTAWTAILWDADPLSPNFGAILHDFEGCGYVQYWGVADAQFAPDGRTAIDKDPSAFDRLGSHFSGQTIAGVGFDRDVLLKAEIEQVDGLAAVTASDEANAVTAELAQQVLHVPNVVARMHDPHQAEIYHKLGLETISPLDWGTQRIADLLLHSHLNVVPGLSNGKTESVEVTIPPQSVGRSVKNINIPAELMVIAFTRRNHASFATMGTVFEDGDIVHICVTRSAVDRLNKLLGLN